MLILGVYELWLTMLPFKFGSLSFEGSQIFHIGNKI